MKTEEKAVMTKVEMMKVGTMRRKKRRKKKKNRKILSRGLRTVSTLHIPYCASFDCLELVLLMHW